MPWYSKFYDSTGLVEVGGVNLPACSWFGAPPDDLMEKIKTDMSAAEQSGDLVDLFKCRCKGPELTDRQKFKGTIKPGMKLYKNTFKKILGYELTTPGFADEVLDQLEVLGCSHAREYYETVKKNEWQQEYSSQMKNTGEWYRRQDFERKEVNTVKDDKRGGSKRHIFRGLPQDW